MNNFFFFLIFCCLNKMLIIHLYVWTVLRWSLLIWSFILKSLEKLHWISNPMFTNTFCCAAYYFLLQTHFQQFNSFVSYSTKLIGRGTKQRSSIYIYTYTGVQLYNGTTTRLNWIDLKSLLLLLPKERMKNMQ